MGKKTITVTALLLLSGMIYAGGWAGADILREKTGVRAIALGGAYTAMSGGVESINYNPAGLTGLTAREAELFYNVTDLSGLQVFYGAFGQPFETFLVEGFFGAALSYRTIPEIANDDAPDPSVDYYDLSFAASFADTLHGIFSEEFFKQISYGLTARIILQQIGPHRGSAIAFDAGLVFAPENTGFRAGLSLMNVGLPMGTIRGDAAEGDPALSDSPLPLTLKLGAYYLMKIDESNETGISADYSHDFYDFGSVSLGIEHSLMKTLYLRLGYCLPLADNNPHTLSAGLGIYITTTVPVEVTVGLNYAFKLLLWDAFNEPGPGHAASLILRF